MIKIFSLLFAFFILQFGKAQKITGTVVSEKTLQPIAGVTIQLKGEKKIYVTGAAGEFNLSLPLRCVLIFSHVGYKTREHIIDSSGMRILLQEDAITMQEVKVSTGYQEVVKESTTGSFDKIETGMLNRSVSTDVLSKLEGISSSVFFSKLHSKSEIYIRGISTISSGTAPLVVLDNFPYEGDINNINPNEVESITILKDAAAAAIWGAKAGNGVIVITTKKGKFGQKPQLSVNTNITFQPAPDLFKDPGFINSSDFIDLEKFLFSKGKYDADLTNTSSRPLVSPVVELLAKVRAGQLSQTDADAQINKLKNFDIRSDYEKYLYRTAVSRQQSLSLSGGSGAINYILSSGADENLSNVKKNNNQRYTFFSAVTVAPIRNLEIHAGINYTNSGAKNNGISSVSPGNGKSSLYPYARLVDDAGNPVATEKNYRAAYTDTAGGGLLLDWKYRPLDDVNTNDNTLRSQDLLLKGDVRYRFSKFLNFDISGQFEKTNGETRNFYSTDNYYTRDLINRFSQRVGTGIKRNIPLGGILDESTNELSAYAFRGQLNYARQIKKWHINVIAGGETRETHAWSNSFRTYGYDDNILTYQNVDYLSTFTLYGNFGTGSIENRANFDDGVNRYLSAYMNSSVAWKGKYIFSASARKDASNLFGVNTNQKWNPLWSAGFAWKVSDESFYPFAFLPYLRARVNYGYNGNIKSDLSALATINYLPASIVTNLIVASVNNPPNPDLTWERSGILNTGIDFASKNKMVEGSVEYFHKICTGLLSLAPLDPTTGISQMTMNIADLTGDGVDVKLNTKISDRKLKVNVQFLFSYVTNRITQYKLEQTNKGGYANGGDAIVPIVGKDPYSIISYRWGGLDNSGDPQGYINDTISKNYSAIVASTSWHDLVFSGTGRPPYYGNIIPVISWKSLTLSANISYKFGYYFRRSSLNYSALLSTWAGNGEYAMRWQKPGDELITNVPALVYPANSNRDKFYNYSEATVEKGDNIRLQDISIKYHFKKVELYGYLNNIGIIWRANKLGLDPDYGGKLASRMSIAFGIRTTF